MASYNYSTTLEFTASKYTTSNFTLSLSNAELSYCDWGVF